MQRKFAILWTLVAMGFVVLIGDWILGRGPFFRPAHSTSAAKSEEDAVEPLDSTSDTNGVTLEATERVKEGNPIVTNTKRVLGKAAAVAANGMLPRAVKIMAAVAAKNGQIHFYGLVKDQHDQPIPRVRFRMDVREWFFIPPSYFDARNVDHWVESDKEGKVELKGLRGDSVCIKEAVLEGGDVELKGNPCFTYDPGRLATGDVVQTRENPALLRVWKSTGRQPLLTKQWDGYFLSGKPFFVDLIAGKVYSNYVAAADLMIQIDAVDLQEILRRGAPGAHDLRALRIVAMNGGILESEDPFLYEAPLNGYSPGVTVTTPRRGPTESGRPWEVRFYFFTRGKFYGSGRFSTSGSTAWGESPLFLFSGSLDYRFDPAGGRGLQESTNYSEYVEASRIDRKELSRKTARGSTNAIPTLPRN